MKINSRRKGATAEREFAELLRSHGYAARRGVQYQGSPDSPDVICKELPIHWEVKRTKRLSVYKAIEQAVNDSPKGKWRVVAHRADREDWLAILPMEDFMDLIDEWKHKQ